MYLFTLWVVFVNSDMNRPHTRCHYTPGHFIRKFKKVKEAVVCPGSRIRSEGWSTRVLPQQLPKVPIPLSFSLFMPCSSLLQRLCKLFHWNFLQYEVWLRGNEGSWTFFLKASALKFKKEKTKKKDKQIVWQRVWLKLFCNYPLGRPMLSNFLVLVKAIILSECLFSF